MKNPAKTGTSAKNGNSPAPYTKYRKRSTKYDMDALKKKFPVKS